MSSESEAVAMGSQGSHRMPKIQLTNWFERGRRVLRVLGTFDADASRELGEELGRGEGHEVVIDVSLVRGLDDVGVVRLAQLAQRDPSGSIALRGLNTHQRRILRYLGTNLSDVHE